MTRRLRGSAMQLPRIGLGLLIVIGVTVGCQTSKTQHDLRVPMVEYFGAPPDEARYNNAPEKGYTAPRPKKEFKPGFGGPGGPGGAGGAGGGGGGLGPR